MPRSLLARSLEPLVAISWGLFLFWSGWLAVVWIFGINQQSLGLPIGAPANWSGEAAVYALDRPAPPYADLRGAILVLAENAELAWLALALIQLHLQVIAAHGMNTARTWVATVVGGAFLLAAVNRAFGVPFGWMHYTRVLGTQFFGVPLGWLLLWSVLLIGAREAVLRLRPRASHVAITTLAALAVLATVMNLYPVARDARAWWFWHSGDLRQGAETPWYYWAAWFAMPWSLLYLLREYSVTAAATQRSAKPLVIVLLLNAAALATNLRMWLR